MRRKKFGRKSEVPAGNPTDRNYRRLGMFAKPKNMSRTVLGSPILRHTPFDEGEGRPQASCSLLLGGLGSPLLLKPNEHPKTH